MSISFYTPTHTPTHMECVECHSTNTTQHGFYYNRNGKYQRYKCKTCGRVFVGESIEEATKRMDQK